MVGERQVSQILPRVHRLMSILTPLGLISAVHIAVAPDPIHVLRRILPDQRTCAYNLRPRAHGFMLPAKDGQNTILRLLFH